MKCPNCGAETNGKFCAYCGSELPYSGPQVQNTYNTEHVTHHVTNVYYVNTPGTNYPPAQAMQQGYPMQQPFPQQQIYQTVPFSTAPQVSDKSRSAALLLCFFLGYLGAHLFYAGRWKKGLLYFFTAGICGIGWLIDFFVIWANKFKDSKDLPITGKAKGAWLVIIAFTALFVIYALTGNY